MMCQTKAEGGKRCYQGVKYTTIFSKKELEDMIEQKMVFISKDEDLGISVLKYTKPAVYTQTWNNVTKNCRGLVIDNETGEVLARPFAKFYNYNEPSCPPLDWDEEGVTVMDKADGSLGIFVEKHNILCTPGSSKSAQAIEGTKMLRQKDDFKPVKGRTYMFEIIYPEIGNVLDYGDTRELILLGATNTNTGEIIDVDDIPEWTGKKIEKFPVNTLRETIAMPPRKNAEGFVVRFKDGTMVKVKQEDYMILHKKLSNLTPRLIWEHMYARALMDSGVDTGRIVRMGIPESVMTMLAKHDNDLMITLKDDMPEEWYDYIEETYKSVQDNVDAQMERIKKLRASIPTDISQKERALYVKDNFDSVDHGFLMTPKFDELRVRASLMKDARPKVDHAPIDDES